MRDNSLVGIQVLSSSSRRRISAKPEVAAACATDSVSATAVIVTNVPICIWARLTTTGLEKRGRLPQPGIPAKAATKIMMRHWEEGEFIGNIYASTNGASGNIEGSGDMR